MTSRGLTILAAAVCGLFSSGCLVVTSNHVSKPVAPREAVELRGDTCYVRHFKSANLDFDLSICNGTERFQLLFFLWVLPVPTSKTYVNSQFEVQADFRPVGKTVLIDPWHLEYLPTNGIPIAPAKIWQVGDTSLKPLSGGPVPVSQHESFRLEYGTPNNPDAPFKLSIGGIFAQDQTNFPALIDYRASKITRAEFRLPY